MVDKFRKKPVVIEAIQYLGPFSVDEMCEEWGDMFMNNMVYNNNIFKIYTLEGPHFATIGDYIIKGIAGEFYPCKEEIFKQTYEQV